MLNIPDPAIVSTTGGVVILIREKWKEGERKRMEITKFLVGSIQRGVSDSCAIESE